MAAIDTAKLLETSFKYTEWLQRFPLDAEHALTYFAHSPFYDRTCNNEQINMQTTYSGAPLRPEELAARLRAMTGTEYAVGLVAPPVILIHKQRRVDPDTVEPITTYYIIDGTVFQAPSLHRILTARFMMSLYHLESALNEVHQHVTYDPVEGYRWANAKKQGELAAADTTRNYQLRGNVDALLQQLADLPTQPSVSIEAPVPVRPEIKRETPKPSLRPLSRTNSPAPTAPAQVVDISRTSTPAPSTPGSVAASKKRPKTSVGSPVPKKAKTVGTPTSSAAGSALKR